MCSLALVAGCGGGATRTAAKPGAGGGARAAGASESFLQDVPGAAFKFEMVRVPASADGAVKAFWIGKTELTWEAFDAFVFPADGAPDGGADAATHPTKPYLPPDRGFGHEGYAAIAMSHKTAAAFCAWLSERSGRRYRLPTEAEWERACSAGGPPGGAVAERAWFAGNSGDKPHQVGTRTPNALGVCDMLGNVAEWCEGRDGGPVTRGGSYRDPAERVSCAAREEPSPAWNARDPQIPKSTWWLSDAPFVGFRVVCEDGPVGK